MKIETKCPKCKDVTLHSVITMRVRVIKGKHFHTTHFHCLLCDEKHYVVVVTKPRPTHQHDNSSPHKNQ